MTTSIVVYVAFMLTLYFFAFIGMGWVYVQLFKWNKDIEDRKRNRKP